ncbi:hypothetical protein OH77DRAFT_1523632 [Trametes cingulata]|nr:hypothetical protein OH77DRAFT_1523632 [Trametes cingulata]
MSASTDSDSGQHCRKEDRNLDQASVERMELKRLELKRLVEVADAEHKDFSGKYAQGIQLRGVPNDVRDLMQVCKTLRREALQARYDGLVFVQYILRLRARAAEEDPSSYPPLPDEIEPYINLE